MNARNWTWLALLLAGPAAADCGGGGVCCQENATTYVCRAVNVGYISTYTSTTVFAAGFTPGDAILSVSGSVQAATSCALLSGSGVRISRADTSYDVFLSQLTTAKIAGAQVDLSISGTSPTSPCTLGAISLR